MTGCAIILISCPMLLPWKLAVRLLPSIHFLLKFAVTRTDYMGGCTDPSYSAASFPNSCSDLHLPDVVYNQTTKIWHCCGLINGSVRCDTPTDETLSAPAPSALSVTFSGPSSCDCGFIPELNISNNIAVYITDFRSSGNGWRSERGCKSRHRRWMCHR